MMWHCLLIHMHAEWPKCPWNLIQLNPESQITQKNKHNKIEWTKWKKLFSLSPNLNDTRRSKLWIKISKSNWENMVSKTEILLETAQPLESNNNGEDKKDKLIKIRISNSSKTNSNPDSTMIGRGKSCNIYIWFGNWLNGFVLV